MSIGYKEIIPLMNTLQDFEDKKNISFCELGNNYMKGHEMDTWLKSVGFNFPIGGEQHNKGVVSKTFWSQIGFDHTSIDLNGFDGSLKLDLREDISVKLNKKFDIVYDGGTGEHVENQYMCFKNIHNITNDGGLMIHILPKVGYFPLHCQYYYTIESFKILSKICDYELVEIFEHEADGGIMIYSTLKKSKSHQDFVDLETFKSVPIHFVSDKSNDKLLYPYAYK